VDTYLSDEAVTLNMEEQNIDTLLHKTAQIKSSCDLLRNILKNSECPPFLICGPNGNGKSLLINSIVSEFTGYQLVTIKCSAQINANQVLYILKQNCLVVSGIRGKEFKPKQSRLILFMKNIDLCPVDNWGEI
jgi:dynein heavy chain 2, cytosolic